MEYMNAKQAADRWGISERRVRFYCAQGKLPGAVSLGKQWMIPADAVRPVDGRTKESRSPGASESYIFPALAFTGAFSRRKQLSPAQQTLLELQLLHLEGKFSESYQGCAEFLSEPLSRSVLAGAFLIQGFNALMLGLPEELAKNLHRLQTLMDEETQHREDYRLLHAWLSYHVYLDSAVLDAIDTSKLDRSALTFYSVASATRSVVSQISETVGALSSIELFCLNTEVQHCDPASMSLHCVLAAAYAYLLNEEKALLHLQTAYGLVKTHSWYNQLAKYYATSKNLYDSWLTRHDPKGLELIRRFSDENVKNWWYSGGVICGTNRSDRFDPEQLELLHLVRSGYSVRSIADMKGKTTAELQLMINELCHIAGVEGKKELEKYSDRLFTAAFPSP